MADPSQAPQDITTTSQSDLVIAQLAELKRDVNALREKLKQPSKDRWDKVGTVSPLISGVVVAAIGAYATFVYNARQQDSERARKAQELAAIQVQTVERFFPHLVSRDEREKEAAIEAIAALGNEALATKLALTFRGPGSRAALGKIASSPDVRVSKPARDALAELFSSVRPSIVGVGDSVHPLFGSGFFVSPHGVVATTAHIVKGLGDGGITIRLSDGKATSARVVRIVEADDLAFLQTTIERVAIPLRPSGALPAVGSTVFALCFVSSGELIVRSGFVARSSSGLFDQTLFGETPFGGNTDSIIVTMNTAPGISGAPVHDTEGHFIGMVASVKSNDLVSLIPASHIQSAVQHDLK